MKPKKDLNYIAKVEQAIAKKYGEEAIQNPASFWDEKKEKEYLEQLKKQHIQQEEIEYEEKVNAGGFFIPKKLINREVDRICPICKAYSFKIEDDIYMNKYECCFECFIKYIDGREERWIKGWRPKNG